MEVVAEYSRLLSVAKSLMMAMSTGFPAESRRTPLQESAGEAWRTGTRTNARTRKEARTSRPAQESIERHYTRVDSDHDCRPGSAAKSWCEERFEKNLRRATRVRPEVPRGCPPRAGRRRLV